MALKMLFAKAIKTITLVDSERLTVSRIWTNVANKDEVSSDVASNTKWKEKTTKSRQQIRVINAKERGPYFNIFESLYQSVNNIG